jgi:hypothetical protein
LQLDAGKNGDGISIVMIDSIWIQPKYDGREAVAVMNAAQRLGFTILWGTMPDEETKLHCATVGSVEWCEEWLGFHPRPDFFPRWLNIDWPKGWCGAADFGRLSSGEIALVECHHPYACGWYGEDHSAYVIWVVEGWKMMQRLAIALKNP